jgi:hypothetical protein
MKIPKENFNYNVLSSIDSGEKVKCIKISREIIYAIYVKYYHDAIYLFMDNDYIAYCPTEFLEIEIL